VNLNGGLFHPIFNQEGGDLGALISLELDDLTHLLVVNERSITGEFLKTRSDEQIMRVSGRIILPS
jgi:hypothetical protein